MNLEQLALREITRRHFFAGSGLGIGSVGLASLLGDSQLWAAEPKSTDRGTNPLAPRQSLTYDTGLERDVGRIGR